MIRVHLFEIDAYHRASGHVHRWFLATAPGYRSRSDDTPPSVTWLPLVSQWASVTIQAAGGRGGSVGLRVDDLRLVNVRAADDLPRWANVYDVTAGAWLRVELGERPLNPMLTDYVVRRLVEKEVEAGAPYGTAVTVWQAKAGMVQRDRKEIRIPVYDRQRDFDVPVLPAASTYAGTGGLEGPAELKGVTRERSIGLCPIVAPTYLGYVTGKHRYSVNGGRPIEGVPRAWDSAAVYDLVTGTPAETGEYSVDVATGIITVGGSKPVDFRCEVHGDKPGGVWHRHIGAVVAQLATEAGLVATVDASGMDATPRTVGVYLPAGDTTTHRALYDRLVGSVARGRWYMSLDDDQLVVTRLPRPAVAVPTRTYRLALGNTPGLQPLASTTASLTPARQVVVRHTENPHPATSTANSATAADVALWTTRWRDAPSADDAALAAAWGGAAKVEYPETALTVAADAEAEAPLWLAELSDPPQQYELKVRDGALGLWIGGAVLVEDNVAGFERGDVVVIYGRTNRDRGGGATLFVEAQTTEPRLLTEDGDFLTTEDGGDFLIVG